MNTSTDNDTIESNLGRLSKNDLLALINRMVQLYPDLAEMIKGADAAPSPTRSQPHVPFNAKSYRLKVRKIFDETDRMTWGSEARAAGPLYEIVRVADEYVRQQDYADAATLYEIIVRETIANYDTFQWHAEEGNLDEVVGDCIVGLGTYLHEEKRDVAMRQRIIKTLREVYELDVSLENEEPVMSRHTPAILTRYTTREEREQLAQWMRHKFKLRIDWHKDDVSDIWGDTLLLLGLEADTLDDETFLRVCRESESYAYLVERLLTLGRVDEAIDAARQAEDDDIVEIADILVEHGDERHAEQLLEERVPNTPNTGLLTWLKKHYEVAKNTSGILDMSLRLFQTRYRATIEQYREIRQLAQSLNQWDTVRSDVFDYLRASKNISLPIEIALDEGQVEQAVNLLKAQTEDKSTSPYGAMESRVGIMVARAAETMYPQDAIEIYQRFVEMLIEQRGRENYRVASQYLINIRKLYTKMKQVAQWKEYISQLNETYRKLPALKDEMSKAKL